MPKTFPIRLEVEEIALGTVLRKLNEMPGIVKLDLDLGKGGEGAGKEKLVEGAAKMRGESAEQATIKFLMNGQKSISEIAAHLGGAKSRAYGATHQLRKKGITEPGDGKNMHRLTKKVALQLNVAAATAKLPALPAPDTPVPHSPSGRAVLGSGPIILRQALEAGTVSPSALRQHLVSRGMSPKSVSGIIERAKRDGLIKKNGAGYELTAKGQKVEGAPANG